MTPSTLVPSHRQGSIVPRSSVWSSPSQYELPTRTGDDLQTHRTQLLQLLGSSFVLLFSSFTRDSSVFCPWTMVFRSSAPFPLQTIVRPSVEGLLVCLYSRLPVHCKKSVIHKQERIRSLPISFKETSRRHKFVRIGRVDSSNTVSSPDLQDVIVQERVSFG